jgi:hypothetical protein
MRLETRVDVPKFWDQGYLLIRDVFSKAEIDELRCRALENRERKGDLLSHPHLRKALLDDRVLSIAAQILGDTPVYYGDSTCNLGQQSFDFHKDNADRTDGKAPDWNGKYTQIRFGLYLQDHAWHSGGLRVVPTSHNAVSSPLAKPRNVRTRVGDLVVWNLRTDHAGAATMLWALPRLYLEIYPWARNCRYLMRVSRPFRVRIPRVLFASEGTDRAAIFFTLGREDAHLERFVSYLKTRAYAVENWKNSAYDPDVWEAVRGKRIRVMDVGEEVRRRLGEGDPSLGANVGHVPIPYRGIEEPAAVGSTGRPTL